MGRKSQKKKSVDATLASPFAIQPIQIQDCQVKVVALPSGKFEYCDGASWYPLASESWVTLNAPGTVTSLTAGTGLSGGTITGSGTIALANISGFSPGQYNWPNSLTINAQGQVTGANAGNQPITSIISNSGLTVNTSGGQSLINIFDTGVTPGTYTWPAGFAVNSMGQLTFVTASGSFPINRLSGYPSNASYFLRGDGVWTSPTFSNIDINTGTTGQLNISRLSGYPTSSNTFLRGDGTWILPYINTLNINGTVSLSSYGLTTSGNLSATTGALIGNNLAAYNSGSLVVQSPLSFSNVSGNPISVTTNSSTHVFVINNTNLSATSTGLLINANGQNGVEFGFNNSTNEAYVWAFNTASLKFGTNSTKRMELLNNGSLVMYDSGTYSLSGNYGYLNSSGSTGTSTSSGYYSISCPNRIKASEFNAYSSEKKKSILGSGNTIETEVIEKFSRIPFFKYELKDPIRDGSGICYGVIAESLKEVLPDYVDESGEDWIPNILESVLVERHEDTYLLRLSKTPQLQSHKLRLISAEKIIEAEIIRQDENTLEVICIEPLPDLVFVYGTYESCPSVSKQKLFEMGLVVIQNLLVRVALIENKAGNT